MKSRIVSCDKCKHEWPFEDTKLVETRWKDNKNELFILLSFKCPSCNEEYIVSVDNEITLTEKEEIAKIREAIKKAIKNTPKQNKEFGNAVIYKMLQDKRERLLVRITKHQKSLEEAYLERVQKGLLKKVN